MEKKKNENTKSNDNNQNKGLVCTKCNIEYPDNAEICSVCGQGLKNKNYNIKNNNTKYSGSIFNKHPVLITLSLVFLVFAIILFIVARLIFVDSKCVSHGFNSFSYPDGLSIIFGFFPIIFLSSVCGITALILGIIAIASNNTENKTTESHVCDKCNIKHSNDTNFCTKCGKKLK